MPSFARAAAAFCVPLWLLLVSPLRAGDTWPGWRGPTGQGLSDDRDLPLTWGGKGNANVLWKVPLPGVEENCRLDLNQSSPIIWRDRVFVTMVYWPGNRPQKEMPEHRVACYRTADGGKLWETTVEPGPWLLTDLRGGYAAPTPASDGERVYVLFGSSVLAAIDFDGKLAWRQEITPHAWDVAIGTSPVLFQDQVLVLADGTKTALSRLIAVDRKSGAIRWEQKRPTCNFSHSTPLVAEVKGKKQLIVSASGALQGLDPADGRVAWWCNNPGDVTTPVFGAGLIYCDSARGGPGIAVDPTGTGDVTATHLRWQTPKIPEGHYSSPVVVGDHLYRTHAPGLLRCAKMATGETVYDERLPPGSPGHSSPIATADGRIYLASAGKSVVIKAGPEFKVLAVNDLGDGSAASPAVAGGRLFLKGARYLWCIGKK
jgi:outer membrane protein assembly factor BamB